MPKNSKDNSKNHYEFIKKLAANDRPTRDNALEHLKQFLKTSRTLESLECQKLWRGLFFTMWHSDRPRTQQALAENMASIIDVLKPVNLFTFLDAFWKIMAREWDNLDRHRVDKFYLLIRCYVHHTFLRLKNEQWEKELVEKYYRMMTDGPLNTTNQKVPTAIPLHLCDIYLDELVKVMNDDNDKRVYQEIPLRVMTEPMENLKNHPSKVISGHAVGNFMKDKRLREWGIVDESIENNDNDSEDDEWNGFE